MKSFFLCFEDLPTFSNTVKRYTQKTHKLKIKKLSPEAKLSVTSLTEHQWEWEEGIYALYVTCWSSAGGNTKTNDLYLST